MEKRLNESVNPKQATAGNNPMGMSEEVRIDKGESEWMLPTLTL